MPIEVRCANPGCGSRYRVPPEAAGRSVRCRACGQTFVAGGSTAAETARPAARTSTQAPESVGRFVIRGKLGAGAFGTVYRAYDPQLDREVALKVPNPGVMADAKRAERFLREAKAAANLRHPHIVPVFDAGKDGDTLYIASAFIDGKPLSDDIPEGGTDFTRAARLARELAEALAYAHEQSTVHRDVKPQNVMLDKHDRVHLMDFGLAARQDEAAKLTNDGAVMGTPAYMSPEQAKGETAAVGPAADQYAVGAVLYELLTGAVPFKGPVSVVLHNVIHTDPEPPRKRRADVPRDLETICLKALAKRPADRYPACHVIAADLRRWLDGEPIGARRQNVAERVVRAVRKEPKLSAALAVVLAVLAGSFLVVSNSARQADAARGRAEAALAERDAAEKRAAQAADESLGALGTAAEERQKSLAWQRKAAVERAEAERGEAGRAAATRAEAGREAAAARAEAARVEAEAQRSSAKLIPEARRALQGQPLDAINLLNIVAPNARSADWQSALAVAQGKRPVFKLEGHTSRLLAACFSPDGTQVVTAGEDGTVRAWNAHTGEEVGAPAKPAGPAKAACLSPDGARVVLAREDGTARVVETRTGKEVSTLSGHTSRVQAAGFSLDGTRVVTAGEGVARVWDAATGKLVVAFTRPPVSEFDALTGQTGQVLAACLSPDGMRVALTRDDRVTRVWEVRTGKQLVALDGGVGSVRPVCFSPDGSRLLTVGAGGAALGPFDQGDGTARVWDVATGKEVTALTWPGSRVHTACFSPDGARVATASEGGAVRVWDARSGKEGVALTGHTSPVRAVGFSPDGRRLATAGEDKTALVWYTPPGSP